MKITSNIDTVIKQIQQHRDNMDAKMHTVLERLAEIGIDIATVRFQTAQYDGNNDVEVSGPEWISETQLLISATGSSVTFIEFGSGVEQPAYHDQLTATKLGFIRGEYGKGRGKRRAWGYYDDAGELVITHGNPPARAFYDAEKEMMERATEIVWEVFRND